MKNTRVCPNPSYSKTSSTHHGCSVYTPSIQPIVSVLYRGIPLARRDAAFFKGPDIQLLRVLGVNTCTKNTVVYVVQAADYVCLYGRSSSRRHSQPRKSTLRQSIRTLPSSLLTHFASFISLLKQGRRWFTCMYRTKYALQTSDIHY